MKKHNARKRCFWRGYNCAQAGPGAFAPEMGSLSVDAAARLASGFWRRHGTDGWEVCGAVKRYDAGRKRAARYNDPKAGPEKTDTYAMIQELAGRFRAEKRQHHLPGAAGPGPSREGTPQAEARTPEYYKKRPCPELVALAAQILEEWLAEHPARL